MQVNDNKKCPHSPGLVIFRYMHKYSILLGVGSNFFDFASGKKSCLLVNASEENVKFEPCVTTRNVLPHDIMKGTD